MLRDKGFRFGTGLCGDHVNICCNDCTFAEIILPENIHQRIFPTSALSHVHACTPKFPFVALLFPNTLISLATITQFFFMYILKYIYENFKRNSFPFSMGLCHACDEYKGNCVFIIIALDIVILFALSLAGWKFPSPSPFPPCSSLTFGKL